MAARLTAITEWVFEISSDMILLPPGNGCLLQNIPSFCKALALHRQGCCKNITHLKKLDPPHSLVLVNLVVINMLRALPMVAMTSLREI
jgi:hypothetical protein